MMSYSSLHHNYYNYLVTLFGYNKYSPGIKQKPYLSESPVLNGMVESGKELATKKDMYLQYVLLLQSFCV
jgi:hypothetical protein